MELGVYSLTERTEPTGGTEPTGAAGRAALLDRVRDVIDYGVRADEVGLDAFGIGEHHTPRFAVASPSVVLAAVAARTSRITLTSAVSVLSVLDPVRLYQDFAQLDLVSGGRAEITTGRSAYGEPFDLFGVPVEAIDDVFEEKLELLLGLRRGTELSWSGRYRTPLQQAVVPPRLDRELPVRIGVGGTRQSAERAGRLGLPMTLAVLVGDPAGLAPIATAYRAAARQHGHDPSTLSIGSASHFHVGPTSREARDTFYPHYRAYVADGRGIHLDRETFDAMCAPRGPLVVGGPREVADKILRQREALGIDRFLGQVDIGGLPRATVLESIDRFAADVAPLVRGVTG
ncbi:LLM class flavin-dependent oxidoreductase [Agromyces sp. MMS24-K17]|uniref:LLM class flavin-dependent oxidoreductase n=1 Tax=Agromyces sp. MMS24-K17 TaxID=3372850 RepID=UPI00375539A2